jgi:eukaryotic-like serine/threonine-protein kinase
MTAWLGEVLDGGAREPTSREIVASPSEHPPILPGSVIGDRYVLERPLSSGGMGTLWIAQDRLLEIRVAIKLIRDDLVADSVGERLLLEARLAARIEHPAIVRVLGLDKTPSGAPFIVMELLEGEDLRGLLDRMFRLSPTEAVQLLLPIAGALVAAHDCKVLHRDLKPENVFIASVHGRSQPKVVDFGIAAPLDRQRRRLTCAGAVVGSPDYLSPEQALGSEDVDERSDVWGFCAVLYECVTGFPPFSQSRYESLLQDVIEKPVRPFSEFGIDDGGLWPIVDRGLSKPRDLRWPDMRSLGVALARWLLEHGVNEDVCGRALRSDWLASASVPPAAPAPVTPVPPEQIEAEHAPTLVRQCTQPAAQHAATPVRHSRPRRRMLLAGLAILLAAACAQAGVMFQPARAGASERVVQSLILTVDEAPTRRALPRLERPAPVEPGDARAEKPKPRQRVKQHVAPRAADRAAGFDPVLGF